MDLLPDDLDAGAVSAVATFNALPGIRTISSCSGLPAEHTEERFTWHIAWQIRPAVAGSPIADCGPDVAGWLTTEWLLWCTSDLRRTDPNGLVHKVRAVDPINGPGEGLSFWVFGKNSDPGSIRTLGHFAAVIRDSWDAYGQPAVTWPSLPASEGLRVELQDVGRWWSHGTVPATTDTPGSGRPA
ncbi:hypothetical protein [Kitasatospora sp. NBC_01302]|uniref:hypothetical protein n=1 Tax=Kitasatospora sp. NBC_01302 TaxID=2903575 RepID=UPI002E1491DA|nr:hypothetical protein OG294_40825 [Kitasatospora sp. NBC_01302]